MSIDLTENSLPHRTDVTFRTQAVRNVRALALIKENCFDIPFSDVVDQLEQTYTENKLLNEPSLDTSRDAKITYNKNIYKRNMDDYIHMQTTVVYNLVNNLRTNDYLPPELYSRIDEFDVHKIRIQPYIENRLLNMFNPPSRETGHALQSMRDTITAARQDNAQGTLYIAPFP